MSADLPTGETLERTRAVRVQAVFHVTDDERAQAVAAKMIDRAYEIANLPECECDVDVNVEMAPPDIPVDAVDLGNGPARARSAER